MTHANEKTPRKIHSLSFGIEVIEIVILPTQKPDLHTLNSIIFLGHIQWGPLAATRLSLFSSLFQLCSDTPGFKTLLAAFHSNLMKATVDGWIIEVM